jgi:hypothetical protein
MLPMSLAQAFGAVFKGLDRMDRDALLSVFSSAAGLALVFAALASGGRLVAVGLCELTAGVFSLVIARLLYQLLRAKPLFLTQNMARHLWTGGAAIVSLTVVQAAQSS